MMDAEPSRNAQARAEIQAILDQPEYENIPFRLAQDWGINSSHFSRLFAKDVLSDYLDDLLVEKGMLEKKPPKDPRPRVWMRTDNIDLAVDTLFKHYKLSELIQAMTRHPDGQDIVSVEYLAGPKGLTPFELDAYYHELNQSLYPKQTSARQNQAKE
jgi:hypothetical protein